MVLKRINFERSFDFSSNKRNLKRQLKALAKGLKTSKRRQIILPVLEKKKALHVNLNVANDTFEAAYYTITTIIVKREKNVGRFK